MGRASGDPEAEVRLPQRRRGANDVAPSHPTPPKPPSWAAEAAELYREFPSARVVADLLGLRGIKTSKASVLRVLHALGANVALPAEREPRKHPGLGALRIGFSDLEIAAEKARWRERGLSKLDAENAVVWMQAARAEIDYFYYTEDELFADREVIKRTMRGIQDWHQRYRTPISGKNFETFMANIWEDLGLHVEMPVDDHDGADHYVTLGDPEDVENNWILISCKSQNRAKASQTTINIDSVARHHVKLIDRAEHCAEAVRQAVEHLGRYERMIYLRSTRSDHYPGRPESAAHRYIFLEVPKDDMAERMLAQLDEDAFLAAFKKSEFRAKNTFNLPVTKGANKVFSVSVTRKQSVPIRSIVMDGYCRQIASYWSPPLPTRGDQAKIDRIDKARGIR